MACSGPRASFKGRIYSISSVFTGEMCMFQPGSTNTQKQKNHCKTKVFLYLAQAYGGHGQIRSKNKHGLRRAYAILETRIQTRHLETRHIENKGLPVSEIGTWPRVILNPAKGNSARVLTGFCLCRAQPRLASRGPYGRGLQAGQGRGGHGMAGQGKPPGLGPLGRARQGKGVA